MCSFPRDPGLVAAINPRAPLDSQRSDEESRPDEESRSRRAGLAKKLRQLLRGVGMFFLDLGLLFGGDS